MSRGLLVVAVAVFVFATAACGHETPAGRPSGTVVSDPGEIPVATGSAALIEPGGVVLVQHRLVERGYLSPSALREGRLGSSTRAALRRFQAAEGLPATGVPTYLTVERLGLEPERVFRSVGEAADAPTRLEHRSRRPSG